jgi:predicted DCC family thiol-disulfide oxidoreductase YuxK
MRQQPFNKAMIYDDNCPLCQAYTSAFVRTGFLKKENRVAFSQINDTGVLIDWNRARHEIPLIDMDTKKVLYGIDALSAVLQQKFSCVPKLLAIKPVNWFVRKLYKLVSYNRRIIVSPVHTIAGTFDCRPDFNKKYRVLLFIVLLLLSNLFLIAFVQLINAPFSIYYFAWMAPALLFLLITGQVKRWDGLAQYGLVSVIGSFLVLITGLTQKIFFAGHPGVLYCGLVLSSIITIQQIIRRIQFNKQTA